MTPEQLRILVVFVDYASQTKTMTERFDLEGELIQFIKTNCPARLHSLPNQWLVEHGYMKIVQKTITEYVWTNKE